MADDVRLTDLGLIQRYSIAVRGETADRAELVATLRADLAWLQGGAGGRRSAAEEGAKPAAKPAKRAAPRSPAKTAKTTKATKAAKPARRSR